MLVYSIQSIEEREHMIIDLSLIQYTEYRRERTHDYRLVSELIKSRDGRHF